MSKKEDMKTIPNFPDYAVTKDGRVWSEKRIDKNNHQVGGHWLVLLNHPAGYLRVSLCRNGKKYQQFVHSIVLRTYVGAKPKGKQCCHNDGNPKNNKLSNLRWGTPSENAIDAVKHGTSGGLKIKGERNGQAKLTEQDVKLIIDAWYDGVYSQDELAAHFNVDRITINDIICRRTWKHIWNKLYV